MWGKFRKVILVQTVLLLVASFAVLFSFSHHSLQMFSSGQLKSKSGFTVKVAADKLTSELVSVARESRRILVISKLRHAKEENREAYIEKQAELDLRILAFRSFRRSNKEWNENLSVTRANYEPFDIKAPEVLAFMDQNEPNFEQPEKSRIGVETSFLTESYPAIRLSVPILRETGRKPLEMIEIIVSHEWFKKILKSNDDHQFLLLDKDGKLLFQSSESDYQLAENLSHLPAFQKSREVKETEGFVEDNEFPGGDTIYASFHKIGKSGLVLIAQDSSLALTSEHRLFTYRFGIGAIIAIVLAVFGQILLWRRSASQEDKPREMTWSERKEENIKKAEEKKAEKKSVEVKDEPAEISPELITEVVADKDVEIHSKPEPEEVAEPELTVSPPADNEISVEEIDQQIADYVKKKRPEDTEEDAA